MKEKTSKQKTVIEKKHHIQREKKNLIQECKAAHNVTSSEADDSTYQLAQSTKELQFFTPQTKHRHGNKQYGCAQRSGIESLLLEHCTATLLCEMCENCWHCVTY